MIALKSAKKHFEDNTFICILSQFWGATSDSRHASSQVWTFCLDIINFAFYLSFAVLKKMAEHNCHPNILKVDI